MFIYSWEISGGLSTRVLRVCFLMLGKQHPIIFILKPQAMHDNLWEGTIDLSSFGWTAAITPTLHFF